VNNNDILRRIRYTLDFNDNKMMTLLSLEDDPVTREQMSEWLKKDDDDDFKACNDVHLAIFLNNLIDDKRGKKEGAQPQLEKHLTNNAILRKLKIAFNLRDEDILEIMDLAEFSISKHELSAFFRKSTHKNFRACQDQVLRKFLKGMQLKYRTDD